MVANTFLFILLLCGMVIAVIRDFQVSKIPNYVTFPLILVGLAWHGGMNGMSGLGSSAAGLFVGMAVFIIPYMMGGMGAGDVKLLGAAGATLGVAGVIVTAVFSIIVGFFYALVLLIIHPAYSRSMLSRFWSTLKTLFLTGQLIILPPEKDQTQPKLKYAVAIALGSFGCVYLKVSESNLVQNFLGLQFSI